MGLRARRLWLGIGVALAMGMFLWPAPSATANVTLSTLRVDVALRDGEYCITVAGVAPQSGAWLGRSVYPFGVRDKALQGAHEVVSVRGPFSHTFTVPASPWLGGSFEVALWSDKVIASQCTLPRDTWCKRNGFHLSGMLAYRGGWLPRPQGAVPRLRTQGLAAR